MTLASSLPTPRRSRLGRRRALLLAGGLVIVLAALAVAVLPMLRQPLAASPATGQMVDARLILHAHRLPVGGTLSGGLQLSGTLYPSLPGQNTLRLAVRGPSPAALHGAHLSVRITMPGMAMAPIRATLRARGRAYNGAVVLPMLGRYRAAVALTTPAGRSSGVVTLTVPLPGLSGL